MFECDSNPTRWRVRAAWIALAFSALLALFTTAPAMGAPAPVESDSSAVAGLQRDAIHLKPLVHTRWVGEFLDATARLPHIAPRTVLYDSSKTHFYTETEAATLADSTRARLVRRTLDESYYYTTRYGSPLAYARPLELLA